MSHLKSDYLPWTSRFPCWLGFWGILIFFNPFGPLVGLSLGHWIKKYAACRISETLYLFLIIPTFLEVVSWLFQPGIMHLSLFAENCLGTIWAMLWVVAGFVLRFEIQKGLRETEGFEPEIKLVWTAFFSVAYINYCLSVLRTDENDASRLKLL
jgi:hypothetical protein